MKSTTLIFEAARKTLGISRDEYGLCSYLHYRQGYPSQKVPGYCCDTLVEIADFVGVKKRGLIYMLARLSKKNLVEQSQKGGHYRATKIFIDSECAVQKVHREGAKSAPSAVQKVHREGAKSAPDIKEEEKEEKIGRIIQTELPPAQVIFSIEKREKKPPPNSARPPHAAFDLEAETEAMQGDPFAVEQFVRIGMKPDDFATQVAAFLSQIRAEAGADAAPNYPNRREFRRHFFNWVRRRVEAARPSAGGRASTPPRSGRASINRWDNDRPALTEKQAF